MPQTTRRDNNIYRTGYHLRRELRGQFRRDKEHITSRKTNSDGSTVDTALKENAWLALLHVWL
jgi:hypothetical protein